MRTIIVLATAAALTLGMSAASYAADMPAGVDVKEVATPGGAVVVLSDAKGMTLYTFDMDKEAGKSVCNGQCADFWPPLMADADAHDVGDWNVVTRDDGAKMWAYHGMPLYTFVKDTAVADFNGNGVPQDNPVWHCAVPM